MSEADIHTDIKRRFDALSDKGTAEQAIDYALLPEHIYLEEFAYIFLRDWRSGDLTDWPDYRRWLGERVASSGSGK